MKVITLQVFFPKFVVELYGNEHRTVNIAN